MNHEIELVHKFCIGLKIVLLMEGDIMKIFWAVNHSLKYLPLSLTFFHVKICVF